jgi:hypothetical protein
MTVGRLDIEIVEGSGFELVVTVYEDDGVTLRDLTGANPVAAVRSDYDDSTDDLPLACALSGTPTDGTITITGTVSNIAAFITGLTFDNAIDRTKSDAGYWDLFLGPAIGEDEMLLYGEVSASRAISK